VIRCAIEVAYEECVTHEVIQQELQVKRQVPLPVVYKEIKLDCGYRMDMVVEDLIVVEFKTVEALLPVHDAQLLSYLKLSGMPVGLLINFHVPILKDGLRRMVHRF
jgi:GxxExxY protein